jgi:ABC-2 type transport system ATP-binding protein
MISVSHLSKRYGAHLAVDDLSFDVPKGEVVGFLGPNGAGKSTTLRIMAGFLGLTSGKIMVDGIDVESDSIGARARIGYMPEAVPLYGEMRVGEYLAFRAELKGVTRKERAANVELAMTKANVADVAAAVIGKLSKGYRQRVGLADALVSKPPILILDEPTAGLDPNQIREVRDVVRALAKEHTVLLSTHILSEVEAICSRVVVIAKGKLVAQGATSDIARMRRAPAVDVTLRGDEDKATAALKAVDGVAKVKKQSAAAENASDAITLRCTWAKKLTEAEVAKATEAIVLAAIASGAGVRAVHAAGGSLEDVFAELTHAPHNSAASMGVEEEGAS